ncbi:MAG: zinc metallopeptidase [Verrucomicrobiota bacterium]
MHIFLIIFAIALGITFWGRGRYVKIYGQETENRLPSNLSGSELAEKILRSRGVEGVTVARSRNVLDDFYSPEKKSITLAPCHYDGTNFPALAVAAQQAGKAIQDHEGHRPLRWRTSVIRWTVYLSIPLALTALVTAALGMTKTILPIVLLAWSLIAFWNVATIPTELDAGERAKRELDKLKVFRNLDERVGVERVMGASSTAYLDGFFTVISWVARTLMPWAKKQVSADS